jgi:hypothetical protein
MPEELESFLPKEIMVTDDRPPEEKEAPADPISGLGDVLRDHLDEQRRTNEEFLRTLSRPAGAPLQSDINLDLPGIDLNGLPDPTIPGNIEGFYKGLNERLRASSQVLAQKVTEVATQRASGAATLQTTMARVAEDIRAANPDLRDSWIDYASVQVGNQLRAKGLDPAAELLRDPDSVGQSILDYAEAEFLPEIEAEVVVPRRLTTRTAGIRPGGARLPVAPKKAEKDTSLIDDMKSWQSANRIY